MADSNVTTEQSLPKNIQYDYEVHICRIGIPLSIIGLLLSFATLVALLCNKRLCCSLRVMLINLEFSDMCFMASLLGHCTSSVMANNIRVQNTWPCISFVCGFFIFYNAAVSCTILLAFARVVAVFAKIRYIKVSTSTRTLGIVVCLMWAMCIAVSSVVLFGGFDNEKLDCGLFTSLAVHGYFVESAFAFAAAVAIAACYIAIFWKLRGVKNALRLSRIRKSYRTESVLHRWNKMVKIVTNNQYQTTLSAVFNLLYCFSYIPLAGYFFYLGLVFENLTSEVETLRHKIMVVTPIVMHLITPWIFFWRLSASRRRVHRPTHTDNKKKELKVRNSAFLISTQSALNNPNFLSSSTSDGLPKFLQVSLASSLYDSESSSEIAPVDSATTKPRAIWNLMPIVHHLRTSLHSLHSRDKRSSDASLHSDATDEQRRPGVYASTSVVDGGQADPGLIKDPCSVLEWGAQSTTVDDIRATLACVDDVKYAFYSESVERLDTGPANDSYSSAVDGIIFLSHSQRSTVVDFLSPCNGLPSMSTNADEDTNKTVVDKVVDNAIVEQGGDEDKVDTGVDASASDYRQSEHGLHMPSSTEMNHQSEAGAHSERTNESKKSINKAPGKSCLSQGGLHSEQPKKSQNYK